MAEKLDPNDLVTLDDLALSTMWESSALVELLERKGVLTRQEMYDNKQELSLSWLIMNPPVSSSRCQDT